MAETTRAKNGLDFFSPALPNTAIFCPSVYSDMLFNIIKE